MDNITNLTGCQYVIFGIYLVVLLQIFSIDDSIICTIILFVMFISWYQFNSHIELLTVSHLLDSMTYYLADG